jgi:hypothetical protein
MTGSKALKTKLRKRGPKPRPRVPLQPDAIAFTIRGFQALGGPGKTKVYELGKAGVLKVFKDGAGRTMIEGNSGRALLGLKEEEEEVA